MRGHDWRVYTSLSDRGSPFDSTRAQGSVLGPFLYGYQESTSTEYPPRQQDQVLQLLRDLLMKWLRQIFFFVLLMPLRGDLVLAQETAPLPPKEVIEALAFAEGVPILI